ncbi:MAG: hypothetical protein RL088_437 [Verrucomicrobiota bacterium]
MFKLALPDSEVASWMLKPALPGAEVASWIFRDLPPSAGMGAAALANVAAQKKGRTRFRMRPFLKVVAKSYSPLLTMYFTRSTQRLL